MKMKKRMKNELRNEKVYKHRKADEINKNETFETGQFIDFTNVTRIKS